MVELKTAEHVIHFMNNGTISLSRYDEKFISSLSTISRVTTNQVELFYKLIYKYARQLAKHNLEPETLINLPWGMPVVESVPEYTHGHIAIVDNEITFKCPFNRTFINEFRKQEFNTFVWNSQRRLYESKFSLHSLKLLLDIGSKYFKDVHYCPVTTDIIESLYPYSSATCWDPTLMNINGNLMIVSTNPIIDDLIKDITLNCEPATLANIASYGIDIDESVHQNDDFLKFASSLETTVEVNDALNIIPWLKELGCDAVYFSGTSTINPVKSELIKNLMLHGIEYHDVGNFNKAPKPNKYNFPVLFRFRTTFTTGFDPYKVAKIVKFVNSNPINVK